jgi:hypothetical protein
MVRTADFTREAVSVTLESESDAVRDRVTTRVTAWVMVATESAAVTEISPKVAVTLSEIAERESPIARA